MQMAWIETASRWWLLVVTSKIIAIYLHYPGLAPMLGLVYNLRD